MKNTIKRTHYLLYANNYSKEILEDYIKEFKIVNYHLINIGLGSTKTSRFCTVSEGLHSSSIIVSNLHSSLRKKLNNGEYINVVVPCTNHLMAGMLIAFAKRNPHSVKLDHVVEGTLNYCNRKHSLNELTLPVIYRMTLARIIKKFLSIIYSFGYTLSFADNVDISIKSSILYCRKKDGLKTNAQKIKVIQQGNSLSCFSNISVVSPTLAIIGSHIIESYLGPSLRDKINLLKPLSNKLKNLPIDLKKVNVIYLPHPRSKENGNIELSYVYNQLAPRVVNFHSGAKNYILNKNPSHVLSLGGSTLFMELADIGFKGELIAWGFDELIEMGCDQAYRLRDVQKKMDVSIF